MVRVIISVFSFLVSTCTFGLYKKFQKPDTEGYSKINELPKAGSRFVLRTLIFREFI
jgi:hypothetical protein